MPTAQKPNMTKADLIYEVAGRTGFGRVIVNTVFDEVLQVIRESLLNDLSVQVRGFGTFYRKRKASKKARNIYKGTLVEIPEHDVPAYKPSKTFAAMIRE